LQQYIAARFSF